MAYDPLHKPKTFDERRKHAREACRLTPCNKAKSGVPPCVVCANEGKLKEWQAKEKK